MDSLSRIIIIILIGAVITWVYIKKTNKNNDTSHNNEQIIEKTILEYSKAYEPKYLMTLNEKAQFRKLQQWAQNRGLLIFTKVRLLDLITPRRNQDNYKGLLWKIQAKHVDFIVCDNDIRVKCVVEISDNSHKQAKRAER